METLFVGHLSALAGRINTKIYSIVPWAISTCPPNFIKIRLLLFALTCP